MLGSELAGCYQSTLALATPVIQTMPLYLKTQNLKNPPVRGHLHFDNPLFDYVLWCSEILQRMSWPEIKVACPPRATEKHKELAGQHQPYIIMLCS